MPPRMPPRGDADSACCRAAQQAPRHAAIISRLSAETQEYCRYAPDARATQMRSMMPLARKRAPRCREMLERRGDHNTITTAPCV